MMHPPERSDLQPAAQSPSSQAAPTRIGRIQVSRSSLDEACDRIRAQVGNAGGVHLVNAYCVALAERSDEYAACLQGSWLALCDGRPLQWLSAAKRETPRAVQVRGADLMVKVLADGRSDGLRHFLLGSTEDVLADLEEELKVKVPGALICGTESPPFAPLADEYLEGLSSRIADSHAQIVWVALGTPKQDFVVEHLAAAGGVVCLGVGGAFEMLAGAKTTAPSWVSRAGLEWLVRLVQEPRRLWRRYLVGNAVFVWVAARDLITAAGRR